MIRSKAYEGISEDKENKKDDSSQCSEYNEDYESLDYNSFDDDEDTLKEKEDKLIILKNEKRLLTKDEEFITLRKKFSSSLLEVEYVLALGSLAVVVSAKGTQGNLQTSL